MSRLNKGSKAHVRPCRKRRAGFRSRSIGDDIGNGFIAYQSRYNIDPVEEEQLTGCCFGILRTPKLVYSPMN